MRAPVVERGEKFTTPLDFLTPPTAAVELVYWQGGNIIIDSTVRPSGCEDATEVVVGMVEQFPYGAAASVRSQRRQAAERTLRFSGVSALPPLIIRSSRSQREVLSRTAQRYPMRDVPEGCGRTGDGGADLRPGAVAA
jgi:hypothetical protein